MRACSFAVIGVLVAASAAREVPERGPAAPRVTEVTRLVVKLVDEQGKPLTNQSVCMMPVSTGYPQADAGGPHYADKDGNVTIESLPPGEHQYVLRQDWPVPTFTLLQTPPAGDTPTVVTVKKGDLSGGRPDLNVTIKVHNESGRRTVDVVITSNTDRPYTLSGADLQLTSGDYRIFPMGAVSGAVVPGKDKGSLQLAIDWDDYLHRGRWASRRGEDVAEGISPATGPAEGMAYYRVVVANNGSPPFELPKLTKITGRVIDHAGKGVYGAVVYLSGNQTVQLCNGRSEFRDGVPVPYAGPKAVTDKDGRFTLTVVGGDRLVVAAGELVWVARIEAGKEQVIRLPQPGNVTIAYDIEGAAKAGVFRLELKTWEMPEWRNIVQTTRYVKCPNGQTVEVADLEPGEYDACRWIEPLRVGQQGLGGMLDRGTLKVEAGKAAKLEYVRTKGGPISGEVVGLMQAGLPAAFVKVLPEQATGDPRADDEWKLTVFDVQATGLDGQFKTSRIPPGTYTVAAEAYAPKDPREGFLGWRLPDFVGRAKVVVPESGLAPTIRIEMRAPGAATASRPAETVEVTSRTVHGDGNSQLLIHQMTRTAKAPASMPADVKPADVKVGAPLTVGLSIRQSEGCVTFDLDCKDASGSQVARLRNVKGDMPPPPVFIVFDSGGKQVYQATIGYG